MTETEVEAGAIPTDEEAEAQRRLQQFNRALGRSLATWAPQDAGERVELLKIHDPYVVANPEKADRVDSRLWLKLLREAAVDDLQENIDPAAGLYWQLYTVRLNGAELEPYKPRSWKPGAPLDWKIVPGPEYLGGRDAYENDRREWLLPHAARLVALLSRIKLYARKVAKDG